MVHMIMRWDGATPEQYNQLLKTVKWDTEPAVGGFFHAASFDENGLRATDVWESVEDMNNFINNRLMPAVAKLGIPGAPVAEVAELHAYVAPGLVEQS